MSDSSSSEDLFADLSGLADVASEEEPDEGPGEGERARVLEAERVAMARWEAGQRARERRATEAAATAVAPTAAAMAAVASLTLDKPRVLPERSAPETPLQPAAELGVGEALCVLDTGRFACSVETCLAAAHEDA